MQFHVMGCVVHSRGVRWSVAGAWIAAVLLVAWGLHRFQESGPGTLGWAGVLLIGSIGGWLLAFGGAFKDAPVEGFETFKLFRSPVAERLESPAASYQWPQNGHRRSTTPAERQIGVRPGGMRAGRR